MMARIHSGALIGIDGVPLDVEVDAGAGMPSFIIVGLPSTAIQESRERIRTALRNSGLPFPRGKITVNLAPADLKKDGSLYDVPIAIGIVLSQSDKFAFDDTMKESVATTMMVGELSLDGSIRPIRGALSLALCAQDAGYVRIIVPKTNVREASLVKGMEVWGVSTLHEVLAVLRGEGTATPTDEYGVNTEQQYEENFSSIKGQQIAKRALEIAAAGGHNVVMTGPPGAGKTLLAESFRSILPPLSFEESIEVTRIWSAAGMLGEDEGFIAHRPFRSPHHALSVPALIGGGSHPRPGEISLAHRGVLFLDEFPEFPRSVLEALRQPLENGTVSISRAVRSVEFPARCILIAAQNPCPCGYYGDSSGRCRCAMSAVANYQGRISGPLLDRMDIFVDVERIALEEIYAPHTSEDSAVIQARVMAARDHAVKRQGKENGALSGKECIALAIEEDAKIRAVTAAEKMGLSARGYTRALKIAQTIADLANAATIEKIHILEALQYRKKQEAMIS